MKDPTRSLLFTALAFSLAIAASLTPAPAKAANVYYNTNGTFSCRATNFAGQTAFYYNNTYIWNASTTNQYLTCVLPTARVSNANASVGTYLYWAAGATAGSVTCTAQMASYWSGSNQIDAGNTQTLAIAAGGYSNLSFPALTRVSQWSTVNIICNVPAGFKLGLIQNVETD